MAKRSLTLITCEYPPFPGGIATYCKNVVDQLAVAGVTVEVIAPDYGASEPEPHVHRLLGHHRFGLGAAIRAIARMRRPGVRLVHACDIRTVLLAAANRTLGGAPYSVIIHGSEVSKFNRPSPMKVLVRAAYRGADRVLANSHATLGIFTANFGPPAQGVVTWLGVDREHFAPAPIAFENPELAQCESGGPLVCTVGRIEDRKGHVQAIEVIAAARKLGAPEMVYVAAGPVIDPEYRAAALAAAERAGVKAVFPGRISSGDLRRLYRQSACHLLCATPLPTKIEGFGFVILEAAAQGCPTIATRVGGIPEVIGSGGDGFVCEPNDVQGMAAALRRLLEDDDHRAAAGAAAAENAATFTWERCVRQSFPDLLGSAVS
jgi:phosphatidyl-myo-inositol dimannoside synthase